MDKATIFTLGLIGSIGVAVVPADYSYAQGKTGYSAAATAPAPQPKQPQPIKFGDVKTLTYVVGKYPTAATTPAPQPIKGGLDVGTIFYSADRRI